jgi:hypothetical protein
MRILIALCLCASLNLSSQQLTWQRAIGISEGINSVTPTFDGGYIAGGFYYTANGDQDYQLIKLDSAGVVLWSFHYGGTGDDYGMRAQQTRDSGYVIVGKTNSFGAGSEDILLLKINSAGAISWAKTYGTMFYDDANVVLQTADDGFLIGTLSGRMIKTDMNGDTLWTRSYPGAIRYMVQTADGGYAATGAAYQDFYLLKTDSSGNISWSRTYGGSNFDQSNVVQQTTDGGYIIAGWTASFGQGSDDAYAVRVDSVGDTLWTRTYGGMLVDRFYHACEKSDGGFVFTGDASSFTTGPAVFTVGTDANGNIAWDKCYGGACMNGSVSMYITKINDGGFLIGGATYCFNLGIPASYLVRIDSVGTSNCNEINPLTVLGRPATIVFDPTDTVNTNSYIVTAPFVMENTAPHVQTTLCTTVGVNEIPGTATFDLTPNPSAGIFSLRFEADGPLRVFIYDNSGKLIYRNESCLPEQEIDLSAFPAGIYSMRVINGETSVVKNIILF